ncbi:MAG: hypothetical protein KDB46_13675 [Solirubrobacterales bacterium]|nr:hypothetical protein [Solirubrobacterales bacterium]
MNAGHRGAATIVGWSAAVFSGLYFASDVVEAGQGGFSDGQLLLTLVAEAAIPPIVIALWWLQRDRLGALGAVSAWAYAYAYVFFTFTVVYALVDGTPDYDALSDGLGPAMAVHGGIMLLAGIGFGATVARGGMLPAWTGWTLAAGVVLVVATQGAPEGLQLLAAAVRDLGIGAMGVALARSVSQPATAA